MADRQAAALYTDSRRRSAAINGLWRWLAGWLLLLATPAMAQPLTISVRDNLGADKGVVETMVARNPHVQLVQSGEFQISRSLTEPGKLILIDMTEAALVDFYSNAETVFADPSLASFEWIKVDEETRNTLGLNSEIALASLNDAELPLRFDAVVRGLLHVRALTALAERAPLASDDLLLCIEPLDLSCPEDGNSFLAEISEQREVRVGVRNQTAAARFTYVVLAAPGGQLRLLIGNGSSPALAAGALVEQVGEPIGLVSGNYRLFVIMSPNPIGPEQLVPLAGAGTISPDLSALGSDVRVSVTSFEYDGAIRPGVGGGDLAAPGFAPWQVQIFSTQSYSAAAIEADRKAGDKGRMLWQQAPFQRYHRCAGSIIGENLVLTAAHCIAGNEHVAGTKVLTSRAVRVGTQNISSGGAIYRIEAVVVHAGYRPGSQKDDIALLRIAPSRRAVTMEPILLPAAVPGLRRIRPGSEMEVLGWGFTEEVGRGERHDRLNDGTRQFAEALLRIAPMVAMAEADCRRIRGYADIDKKICATSPPERRGDNRTFSCRNDSGGPVIQRLNQAGDLVQVGLVSGGVGCGAVENGVQNPSLFVDLQLFTKWIAAARSRVATMPSGVEALP